MGKSDDRNGSAGSRGSEPDLAQAGESEGAEAAMEINEFDTKVEEDVWESLDDCVTEGQG